MLTRFFKKREGADAPTSHPVPTQADAKAAKAKQADDARAEWLPRVQAAQGDDAALLLITQSAPLWELKLAAVEALAGEEALKQAERELRHQDSRVHRVAKKRLVAAVAQREARSGAQAVIDDATALLNETPLPANRLVAIDRGWQALATELLTPEQLAQFATLREQLNTVLREEGEAEQRQQQAQQQRLAEQARQAEADEEARLAALAAAPPPEPEPEADVVAEVAPPPAPKVLLSPEQRTQLDSVLSLAEAALAEGQLSDMQQRLQDVDNTFDALKGISVGDKLRARHQALHAERARLKGWQQWGGALALDSLVDEAEALARTTLAAADPEAAKLPANPPKLRLKPHADSIQALRARWKEIDRLGAPSNQTLWHRFDAALHTAYQPVAAQQAALKAQRQENLQAREALLATLDAVPLADTPQDNPAEQWKEPLRALNQFQLAWRQLGPLEHTVPSKAKNALLQRLNASVERIEAPLNEARRVAQAERERLVVRAEALVQELARNAATRDAPQRVRELQADWQQHARSLPLARAVEGALWARFRAATDAVFAQREAAFSARDAELATNLAEREALIARLTAIDLDTAPVAEMQRVLGDADRAWRQPVEVPRAAVKSLDTRFSEARAALAQAVAESAQKRWHAQCDQLVAKLSLCEEREAAAEESELASRWAALDALPVAWEKPLAQRWSQAPTAGPLAAQASDDLLLQLEAALDLPASAESQAARRDLKLRALKDTLEGRAAQTQDPVAQRAQWFASALRQGGMSTLQRERLRALIMVLRQAQPGSLGGTAR